MTSNNKGLNNNLQLKDKQISHKQQAQEIFAATDKAEERMNRERRKGDFPTDVFPSPFKELITESNKSLNFPPEYMGTSILSAVSTIIGKSAKLKVKAGWYEFPATYMGIVGNAGATKSHPLEMAYKPIEEMDGKTIESFREQYKEYEEFEKLSKKEKESIEMDKPMLKKTILSNFTPEILYQRLQDNDRGCSVVSEELATWLETMNNYSKGDNSSAYLSFWSNKGTSIDRVSKPVPLWLPEPFLNIIGTLQIRTLKKLFPAEKSDMGFLQRFLFAVKKDSKKLPINDREIDTKILGKYSDWIDRYLNDNPIEFDEETGRQKPKLYYWTKESRKYFFDWQRENTEQVNEYSDDLKGEVLSKFDIHFIRLALASQIMIDHNVSQISLQAVEMADRLTKYFIYCSDIILNILQGDKIDVLPDDKKNLYEQLPDSFTTASAYTIGKNLRPDDKNNTVEIWVKRFINNRKLFKKKRRGEYYKI